MEEAVFPDWATVRSAYRAGDYTRCRALLEQRPGPEAQLWHARMDMRENRHAECRARLLNVRSNDADVMAERDVWLASAYNSTGDFALAHQLLDRALTVLRAPAEAYYRAVCVRALAYYLQEDYASATIWIDRMLRSPDPVDRAQAYAHRSWVAAKQEHLRAQLGDLLTSLEEQEQAPEPDQYGLGHTLVALGSLCRELPVQEAIGPLRRASTLLRITDITAFPHFQLTRILGWIDALQGDELSAMRRWRVAEEHAPSPFWRVFCLADRAYLARAMGRSQAARDILRSVHEHASQLAWSNTQDEERIILLTIAQLFAADDPALAQRYLAQFRSLRTEMHARIGWVGDRRMKALQLYPNGIALLQLGEREAAISMLEEAWHIFTSFEYGWRAALTALDLYEVTHEQQWLVHARQRIAPWPKSWIAAAVGNAR